MPETPPSTLSGRFDLIFRLIGAGVIVVGIFLVLQPFLSALLVAGVLAIATWPLYRRIHAAMGGRSTWSAAVMMLLILVLVVIPITFLTGAAADQLPALFNLVKGWFAGGVKVPEQLKGIPVVGERIYDQLMLLVSDKDQLTALAQRALEPAGKLSVAAVRTLGDGILQLLLVTFIVFFYYRDGHRVAELIGRISGRISGEMSAEVLNIIVSTTRSVFIGIVGTAAAQGLAAFVGFLIAGVPAAFLLSVGTFVLSVVPMGPVLLWGGAAVWLYLQGETGWAIFRVIWGAVIISSIDNFLKPLLIARGSTLSLGLIFLGVLGGVIAFGFIGVILGPVLLALGIALGREWISAREPGVPQATGALAAAAATTAVAPTGSTPKAS
ncbi:MAG TPA: AI-2E family transporter [Burkholderiaceae bacterium]|nr:AI-2E family transporter [Burkholderiaceae bacterium]